MTGHQESRCRYVVHLKQGFCVGAPSALYLAIESAMQMFQIGASIVGEDEVAASLFVARDGTFCRLSRVEFGVATKHSVVRIHHCSLQQMGFGRVEPTKLTTKIRQTNTGIANVGVDYMGTQHLSRLLRGLAH
jgi:hypothetical protein